MGENWTQEEPLDKAAEMAARGARAAGQAEHLTQAIQAAHAAAGAAATGGAVSGATAGSALGGPLGAAVGALVTTRTFWKVAISIVLFLLLFAYVIVNAVGIILLYLGFENAEEYVMQAREAECENIRIQIETLFEQDTECYREICELIEAQRDLQLERIEEDYSDNWEDYDGYEVEDEYETILKPNLSQYLAVLMEEKWSGSQIVGFNGYGPSFGITGSLISPYDIYFTEAAALYQVPDALLKAMAKVESDFDPNAVSHAGAMGIMQLMPGTAANLGVTRPFDPKENIMGGAKYIAELLRTFSAYPNGLNLAIAAYNAGPGAVKRAGYQIPQNGETPAYVEKVRSYLFFSGLDEQEEADLGTPELDNQSNGVSAILLKSLVDEQSESFFGWTQTGTHTETEGSGDDEVEYEIVDYSVVVKISPILSELPMEHEFLYCTNQNSFHYVLRLFEVAQNGKEGVEELLYQVTSWKNNVSGAGTSEDIFTSTILTGGDTISYETAVGCIREVVYYNQGEEPWASLDYGGSNIRTSGCGPTALAIVISTLTGEQVNPQMTAQYAISKGLYVKGKGTSHAFPMMAARNWGLSVERVRREQMNEVIRELKKGKMAVVICAENTITKGGHFIVLTGVTSDGYITIADPGSRSRTGKLYSPTTIQSYARNLSEGGIWIIGESEQE
ncbi:MAG: transglycosylase SLT domain-containing protein [Monoglobales bacterium]